MIEKTSSQLGAAQPASPPAQLEGRMSTVALALSVLAFAAPIAVVSGMIPFTIIFLGASAPIAFALATAVLLLFAVGYTTMTRYVPKPGAFYAYITAGLGRPVGLGASFVAFAGYFALAVGTYQFFGITANSFVINTLGGSDVAWYWYSLGALAGVGILGYLKIDVSARLVGAAMVAEVAIVVVFDVVVFGNGGPEGPSLDSFRPELVDTASIGVAVLFAATAFLGFEATAIYRDEVKNPARTIPRATFLAVISIGILYVVTAWAVITAFGTTQAPQVAATDAVTMFGSAATDYLGTIGYDVVTVLLLTSVAAALIAVQNILSRYVQSLGIDGVVPESLGRVHPKHRSPYVASVVVTATATAVLVVMALLGVDPATSYVRLGGAGGFCLLLLMFLTSVAVVVYFRRNRVTGTTAWHSVVAPSLSAVLLAIILYQALSHFELLTGGSSTVTAVLQGIIWFAFAAGVALALWFRRFRPAIFDNIGRSNS